WSTSLNSAGVVELKVWEVPRSEKYPAGRKFSLFPVAQGGVLVGVDNHKPKGPHLHVGKEERPFHYTDDNQLLNDFWALVRKAGFEP
ncbi:MAG TPA: DUF6516 family protein, partial [Candidatus Acidoferrales bacterium]|nr:DUF6516 family protein [Candidatus Acidoferrales bacterium]